MPEPAAGAPASNSPRSAGVLVFATLVLFAAYGEVATFLLGPAMPALGQIFDKTPATVQLTIVSFAVMFAVGQLFFGPFSDRSGCRTTLPLGAGLALTGSAGAQASFFFAGAAAAIWLASTIVILPETRPPATGSTIRVLEMPF